MSLVLIAHTAHFAVLVSDGRAMAVTPGGPAVPCDDDACKLHPLADAIALAATGDTLTAEIAIREARHHIAARPPGPGLFRELVALLGGHARRIATRAECDPLLESSLTLVGWDGDAGRVRCVGWASGDAEPFEQPGAVYALGWKNAATRALPRLASGLAECEPWTVAGLAGLMQSTLLEVRSDEVGGRLFWASIEGPQADFTRIAGRTGPLAEEPRVHVGGHRGWLGLTATGRLVDQRKANMISAGNVNSVQYGYSGALLTATCGATALTGVITVKTHNVQFGFGSVAYPSGTLTGLLTGSTQHVYMDDPDFDGGVAADYGATNNAQNITGATDRYYVGTITIPGLNGSGNGSSGGGSGGKF
jgi:hypothetical protein